MAGEESTYQIANCASLRSELSIRGQRLAAAHGYLYDCTDGAIASVIFGRDEKGRHGNFHPESYEGICRNAAWARRLEKVHTASRRSRVRANWQWRELDCANSSDALLMNIFCHPEVIACRRIRAFLGVEPDATLEFGFKPRTPLENGRCDNTEVDMRFGDLLVEAKLTESDFQSARSSLITRYRDLESVFDIAALPVRNGRHSGYQLIRGALAAHATGFSFSVLCDARRPDLIETWYHVLCAVRIVDLRCRLKLLTWQELASQLPPPLQDFVAIKYGITSAK
jgi:hypothetical protein